MTLTRIDRVIQTMTQPELTKAKQLQLLASLEDGEGLRSYDAGMRGM